MVLINLTFIMLWVSPVLAGESGRRQTFGNEPTGQAAITFFILANLTVVASILAARAAKSQA